VEVQGHGHTADIDRPLTYEQMADDTAALIKQLGLEHTDIFGISSGGGVALQTAIRHPELVRRLVVVGTPFRSDGEYPESRAMVASFDPDAGMLSQYREAYLNSAPRPEDWPRLVSKVRQATSVVIDLTRNVETLKTHTLIVIGDEYIVMTGSAMGNLSKAQLAVLPATTHFTLLARSDLLRAIMTPFLDAPMPS
jgi:pimeloyl-ACP methyl ester carboxylesterase